MGSKSRVASVLVAVSLAAPIWGGTVAAQQEPTPPVAEVPVPEPVLDDLDSSFVYQPVLDESTSAEPIDGGIQPAEGVVPRVLRDAAVVGDVDVIDVTGSARSERPGLVGPVRVVSIPAEPTDRDPAPADLPLGDDVVVDAPTVSTTTTTTTVPVVADAPDSTVESSVPVSTVEGSGSLPAEELTPTDVVPGQAPGSVPATTVPDLLDGAPPSTLVEPGGSSLPDTNTPASSDPSIDSPVEPTSTVGERVPEPVVVRPVLSAVSVRLVDEKLAQAAGLEKVAFTIETPGVNLAEVESSRVRIEVEYESFADSYGADWAGRLQLVRFPGCWIERPGEDGCGAPRVVDGFVNDTAKGVIYAEVDLLKDEFDSFGPGTFGEGAFQSTGGPGYGLSAGAYSSTGNFATSTLNPTGLWSVGANTGNFSWSYPIQVDAPPAGAAPSVAVSYSSQSIDGLTSDQNTQGGLLGPGWSMGEAFIERSYKSCFNDGGGTADMCFVDDNATISMAGLSGRLSLVDTDTSGVWETKTYQTENHQGWRLEKFRRTDQGLTRGAVGVDNDSEYWVVTDTAGTEYYFGYGNRTGDFSPGTELASRDTVPVRGLQSGEPCYSLSDRWCHQAYRWNLDRVEDAQGRVSTYQYQQFENRYGILGSPSNTQLYTAASALEKIRYGNIYTNAALDGTNTHELFFDYRPRCKPASGGLGTCSAMPTASNATLFPDIPNDQICATTYCTKYAPTFFTPWFLYEISAKRHSEADNTSYITLSKDLFEYEWVDSDGGGAMSERLWLRYVQHSGTAGATITLPRVRFDSFATGNLANRVDYNLSGGVSDMKYYRLGSIIDEFGSQILVSYGQADMGCESPWPSGNPSWWTSWANNNMACYPRWWSPPSGSAGFAIWHKYFVEKVEVRDQTGASPTMITEYAYASGTKGLSGLLAGKGVAWHSDQNPLVPVGQRSWAEFRGFALVTVYQGAANDPNRTKTSMRYHRGMHDDITSHSGSPQPRAVDTASTLGSVPDYDWLNGFLRETRSLEPTGIGEYSGSVFDYQSFSTASNGVGPTSWQVEESTVRSRTQSPQGATYGMVVNTYEASGWFRRLSTTLDHGRTTSSYAAALGDDGSYDHTCTKFEYAAATDRFPVGLPHRVSVHSSSLCSETSVISDQRTFYDYESGDDPNPPAPGELMRGRVSGVWTAVGDSTSVVTGAGVGVGYVYEKTGWEQGSGYGGYFSRPTSTTDARGFTTNIKYRQRSNATSDTNPDLNAAGNHNTYRVQTDNALGDSSYEYFDNYGNHARSTDANLRFSVACYDSLRRLTKVFLPGDPYPTGSTCSFSPSNPPSMQYSYTNAAVPPANTQNFPPASSGFTTVPRWTTSATVMDGSYTASGYRYTQTWTHLDGLARVVETQTPSPVQDMVTLTKTSYDGRGNAYRQSEPYAKSGTAGSPPLNNPWSQVDRGTEQVFDSAGRLVETRLLDNGTPIRHTIVEQGGHYAVTWPMKSFNGTPEYSETTTYYDARGNPWKVVEHDQTGGDQQTISTYNLRNELTSITDADGNVTEMSYNWLGWQTGLDEPNAGARSSRYYETGQVERTIDAEQQITKHSVDPLGRPTATYAGPSTAAPLLTTITYDPDQFTGAIASTRSYQPAGVLATEARFDDGDLATGRVTEYSVRVHNVDSASTTTDDALDNWYSVKTTFTRRGQVEKQSYPGIPGTAVTATETLINVYDTFGYLDQVNTTHSDGTYVSNIVYDGIGRPSLTELAGGAFGFDKQMSYNASDGRTLLSTAKKDNATGFIQYDSYVYDDAGNPTGIRSGLHSGQDCFEYDARQRLDRAYNRAANTACTPGAAVTPDGASPFLETYNYDKVNRFTQNAGRVYTYGAPSPADCSSGTETTKSNAVATIGAGAGEIAQSFTYDCNGSMTSQTDANGVRYLTSDEENRLERVTTGDFNNVEWSNLVNTTPGANSSLTRDNVTDGWTAGATSSQSILADGQISFRFGQNDKPVMVGLATGPQSSSYTDIDYAIYGRSNGEIRVYEDGVSKGVFFTSYSTGNVFTVQKTGTTVRYLRNGTTFYTSTVPAPAGRYVADTALYTSGASINQVRIAGAVDTPTEVTWTAVNGVTVTVDNSLVRGSAASGWTASAASTDTLSADGEISFAFPASNELVMVGLDSDVGGSSYPELDYAIYQHGNEIEIYENGTKMCDASSCGFSSFTSTDEWTIRRVGPQVEYLRNGIAFYTSSRYTSGSYLVDTSFYTPGAAVADVRIADAATQTSLNVYDTTGQRLLRVDPDGTKTVYLGASEIRWTASVSQLQASRYYPSGTMRTFTGQLLYTTTNHQGTITTSVNADTGTVSRTLYKPYGDIRNGDPANERSFLGQTNDASQNLNYLNNRHYDPTTGVFISVDPLVSITREPYVYGSANPVTMSDPTGLCSQFSGTAEQWTCDFPNPNGRTIISGDEKSTNNCRSSHPAGCNSPAPKPPKKPKPSDPPKPSGKPGPGFVDRLNGAAERVRNVGRFVANIPAAIPAVAYGELVGGDCSVETGAVIVCTGLPAWSNGPAASLSVGAILSEYDSVEGDHLRHETGHLSQSAVLGQFYIPVYIVGAVVTFPVDIVRGCTVGTHNPLEANAGPGGGYGC